MYFIEYLIDLEKLTHAVKAAPDQHVRKHIPKIVLNNVLNYETLPMTQISLCTAHYNLYTVEICLNLI